MIAKHIDKLAPSGIRQFFDLVLGMPEVISLGVGEPDFVTPWRIREKAITSLEEGFTSYTSNSGLFCLREGISEHLNKKYNLAYSPKDNILITVGVSEGLDLALRAILEPKDSVIVVTPYYVAYPAMVEINHGRPLFLKTRAEEGFKINLKDLKELLKHNPKAMILNYPANPTGVTYAKDELKAIWKLLAKTETFLITDEVYDELTYDGRHCPFASLDKKAKERTILLNGFSKGHAMTGFRVGYACADKKIIDAMTKIHSFSMLCGPIIGQMAAVEALLAKREVQTMVRAYRQRRDFMVRELNRLGLKTNKPSGAFYCFSNVSTEAMDFAKSLLFQEKVAVVPGAGFGSEFNQYIRISYANSLDNLKEAVIRIERFLNKQNGTNQKNSGR
ncbi:MAG: aminotransferase class I/II-fold pyridoxal phosphate-dependent enzyme [Candidatus Omnitrophica bacterium]|nr:aminotransferase class I/II-fold pyridoxal phosphate-dependent enzyme [Candidatus Omnitrophota bacterium]